MLAYVRENEISYVIVHKFDRLARNLGLTTHMHPKLANSPTSPGVARLDFDSGLFLQRDADEGRWVLEGRTWGHPSPLTVHSWHLSAAAAAHQLDPTVVLSARGPTVASESATRPVNQTPHKDLAQTIRLADCE